jgi:beta-phosphoglucomutase
LKQGVVFDLDGVLIASGPAHAASWRAVARKHGIALTDDAFRQTFGMRSADIIRRFWGERLSEQDVWRIDLEKEHTYRQLVSGMVPLAIGAREVLTALREAGLTLALASSGPPENLQLVLRETRLGAFFDVTVDGADVRLGKPAPDCFLLAARRAALAPADCVAVEDAPVGVQAARSAGMHAIGLLDTHGPGKLTEAGAEREVTSLRQVTPELVFELLGTQA